MPGGGREVQQGVRALGRAVWVDGLDRAPFPVGAGGDEGGSSLSFVLGGYKSRLVDTQTHTHKHRHTKPDNITHSSTSLISQTASPTLIMSLVPAGWEETWSR